MKKLLPILTLLTLSACSYDEPNGWFPGDICSYPEAQECCPECDEDGAYTRGCYACIGKHCPECPECPTCEVCPEPETVYLCKTRVKVCDKWGSSHDDCEYVWRWKPCEGP